MVDWRSGTGVVIWWMEPGVVIWWMEPGVHISEVGEWKLRTAGFWLAELWPELWLAELWPELWLAELWPELWLAELWPELWLAELWPELWLAELWPELWLAELWPVVWGRLKLQHQSYSNFVCHGESMNFDATPLIWRLTKSHSNRMPSLSMSWDPFDTVWHGCGQWVRRNTSKCKTCKKQDISCLSMLKPSKSPSKSLNNNKKKKRTNFNRASHLRCSGPNKKKKRTNFNRASHLRCSGPNNKKKRTNFNRASHLRCSGPKKGLLKKIFWNGQVVMFAFFLLLL